jgi:hypothetical protein
MITSERGRAYLDEFKAMPLDLRRLSAPDAAQALYDFIQIHFEPGDECSLWSPTEADLRGFDLHWRVSWEAGPEEWGVLLSVGESMWDSEFDLRYDHHPEVLLRSGAGWYSKPHFRFDVGFIERRRSPLMSGRFGLV